MNRKLGREAGSGIDTNLDGMGPQHPEHNFEWLAVPCYRTLRQLQRVTASGRLCGPDDVRAKSRAGLGDEDSHSGTALKTGLHTLPMRREGRTTGFYEGTEIISSMDNLPAASCKAAMASFQLLLIGHCA